MKNSHLALVVLTTGLLCVGNAVGQDEKKAENDAAVVLFEEILSKAKTGNADAMVWLGIMYADGEGVTQNFKESVKWLRKAAELGHALAMFNYAWALKLVALIIPLSSVLAHVRYRWNDSYVNFATAMNVLYLGVFWVFFSYRTRGSMGSLRQGCAFSWQFHLGSQ